MTTTGTTGTIAASTTLGEIVTAHPSLARELELRHLDYCCGGSRTLAAACAERGLAADDVAAELSKLADPVEQPQGWATMGVVELADHIEATHHRYLRDELPRLDELVDKIVSVHGARHPELAQVQRTFRALRADLEPHLLKEERVLFPMVRELASSTTAVEFHCGSLRNPISVMLREHDTVGDLLADLRALTGDYTPPADGCASYRACFGGLEALEADTHLHVHKENNLLFPAVVELEALRCG